MHNAHNPGLKSRRPNESELKPCNRIFGFSHRSQRSWQLPPPERAARRATVTRPVPLISADPPVARPAAAKQPAVRRRAAASSEAAVATVDRLRAAARPRADKAEARRAAAPAE